MFGSSYNLMAALAAQSEARYSRLGIAYGPASIVPERRRALVQQARESAYGLRLVQARTAAIGAEVGQGNAIMSSWRLGTKKRVTIILKRAVHAGRDGSPALYGGCEGEFWGWRWPRPVLNATNINVHGTASERPFDSEMTLQALAMLVWDSSSHTLSSKSMRRSAHDLGDLILSPVN